MQQMSKQRYSSSGGFINWTVLGVLLLLLVISLPAVYNLTQNRKQALHEAKRDSEATVNILGQSLINKLEKIDYALLVTTEEVLRQQQRQAPRRELLQFIEHQASHIPELATLKVVDTAGISLRGDDLMNDALVGEAHQHAFSQLQIRPDVGLFISKPIFHQARGVWFIICARRINLPGKGFGGITCVELPLDRVQQRFSQAALGTGGSAALFDANLMLIARHAPHQEELDTQIGKKLNSPTWQQKLDQGETVSGSYRVKSALDGVQRVFAYRRLDPYPLYLNVGVATDEYLVHWRTHLLLTLFALAGCWAGAMFLIHQLYHHKRHTELERLVRERTSALEATSRELASNEERLQALLEISNYPAQDIQELLDFALEKVIQITGSTIGYIYHYHEDQQEFILNSWSKEVMPACLVANQQSVYQLEKTGVWGEAVRQRRSILINDFEVPDPLKKGYPEGHVPLSRFLTVPVFDHNQQIVAVVGVANKQQPYTDQDIQQLELMMAEVWRISKRLELELKLTLAGKEWQSTFDAISDSVSLIGPDQRVLRCNLASTRFFRRDLTEIIGQHCCQLLHGTEHLIEDCPMQRARQSRKTESRLVFEVDRWLQITVDPLLNDQDEVVGAVHIVHDATERVASEQSMRELLSMLEAVQNELYVINPDTLRFEYVNRAAQLNLGLSEAQLLEMTPVEILPYSKRQFVQLIAPLLSGDQQLLRFETTHTRAGDVGTYQVEINLQMVNTSSGRRLLSVVLDCEERKRAELKLAIANERLESASAAANIALWNWDIRSGDLVWSDSVDRMLGMAPGAFPRTIEAWMELVHPDDLEPVNQQLTAHLEQGEPYEVDYRVRAADGTYRDWHDAGKAYWDADGTAIRMSGACVDISERKQHELVVRDLQAQLLQNEKMASIGQLSAGIAHEINNPIGFINSNIGTLGRYVDKFDRYITALETMVQQCAEQHGQQQVEALKKELKLGYVLKDVRQLLAETEEGAGRVMKIVQDLKTFARNDTEQIGNADLNQCLDSTLTIIWNQIKYVAELKKEYSDLPTVPCNIQQVNQVFLNLLVNAGHAIEEKKRDSLGTVTVKTWADNDNAYVAISDTGCGIPEDIRSRIFDPFFTTKDVGKGTGLGLSISHEIIKKHSGELTVTTVSGEGTTFTVRLPLVPPLTPPPQPQHG